MVLVSSSNIFLEFITRKLLAGMKLHVQLHTLNLDITFDQKVMLNSSCLMKPFSI